MNKSFLRNLYSKGWLKLTLLPLSFSVIPDIDSTGDPLVTQTRPLPGANSREELNNTLNAIWNYLFVRPGLIFIILSAIAVIVLINAGMRYISSANNPEQAKAARAMILHAVLAIILIAGAYGILRLMISIGTALIPTT